MAFFNSESYRSQKHVCYLTALPVAVIHALYIPFEGYDSIWAWHLQDYWQFLSPTE
jgi:hypothetical protein